MTREYFILQLQTKNEATLPQGLHADVHPETVKIIRSEPSWLVHRLAVKKLDIFEASEAWQPITSVEAVVNSAYLRTRMRWLISSLHLSSALQQKCRCWFPWMEKSSTWTEWNYLDRVGHDPSPARTENLAPTQHWAGRGNNHMFSSSLCCSKLSNAEINLGSLLLNIGSAWSVESKAI